MKERIGEGSTWRCPEESLTIRPNEAHIWRSVIRHPAEQTEQYRQFLSPEDLQWSRRFRVLDRQQQFVVGRGLLRMALGLYMRCSPKSITLISTPGSPPVVWEPEETHNFRSNISHKGEVVLCIITRGRSAGIDVERIRTRPYMPRIALRLFSASERAAIQAVPNARRAEGFFRCWTSKEAYLKALGIGELTRMSTFETDSDPDAPATRTRILGQGKEQRKWVFHTFSPIEDYISTCVVEGETPKYSYFDPGL